MEPKGMDRYPEPYKYSPHPQFCFHEIWFNIFPSMSRSEQWCVPFRCSAKTSSSNLPFMLHGLPISSTWPFGKYLVSSTSFLFPIMQFSSASYHFILGPNLLHSTTFSNTLNLHYSLNVVTPMQNCRHNYSSVFLILHFRQEARRQKISFELNCTNYCPNLISSLISS